MNKSIKPKLYNIQYNGVLQSMFTKILANRIREVPRLLYFRSASRVILLLDHVIMVAFPFLGLTYHSQVVYSLLSLVFAQRHHTVVQSAPSLTTSHVTISDQGVLIPPLGFWEASGSELLGMILWRALFTTPPHLLPRAGPIHSIDVKEQTSHSKLHLLDTEGFCFSF